MRLEDFNLVARNRTSWEAVDLGLVMARTWRRAAAFAWITGWLLPSLAALALLPGLGWPLLCAWWLKPLGDRLMLKVYSEAVFGAVPTRRAVLEALRESLLSRALWADLTYRRLTLLRSFTLPVSQLERQTGAARRQRIDVLRRGGGDASVALLTLCSLFVTVLFLGGLLLLYTLLPEDVVERNNLLAVAAQAADGWFGVVMALVYFLAESLVEPFYVAAGFALYLNRRTQLEGWDLELALRALATRLETQQTAAAPEPTAKAPRALRDAAVIACVALLSLHQVRAAGAPAAAEPLAQASAVDAAVPPAPPAAADAGSGGAVPLTVVPPGFDPDRGRQMIKEVLANPDFGHLEPRWGWALHDPPPPPKEGEGPGWFRTAWLHLMEALGRSLAWIGSWGVRGIIFVAIIGFLAYGLARLLPLVLARVGGAVDAGSGASELFGLDLRPERLPSDVAGAARTLAASGDVRAALALLYRGALVAVMRTGQIRFARGDTEERCLERIRPQVNAPARAWFEQLVRAWQYTAYAHRPATLAEVEVLCQGWPLLQQEAA